MEKASFNYRYIFGICFLAALGGYLFGFDFAVISGALPFLQKQFLLDAYWEGFATGVLALGAIIGCLIAGKLADKWGRRPGLMSAAALFALSFLAMAFSPTRDFFIVARFFAGIGVGMASMLSPMYIAEISPAELRGRMVAINQLTIVLGIFITNLVNYTLRNNGDSSWRWMFGLGVIPAGLFLAGASILPESPRWLMIHGDVDAAERTAADIERRVEGHAHDAMPTQSIQLSTTRRSFGEIVRSLFAFYPKRTLLGITLMTTQAFCYNAIFFTYALILTKFYGIAPGSVGLYLLPFALGNVLGPLLLGHLFDTVGRKVMIALTYTLSGLIMLVTGWLFAQGIVGAGVQTALWTVNFFFASCGASAAYLTVGESFPLEVRARAIGIFYAFGTALGGITGPLIFGALIESGARGDLFLGYVLGGVLMVIAGAVEMWIGVKAERQSLENVAPPLSRV